MFFRHLQGNADANVRSAEDIREKAGALQQYLIQLHNSCGSADDDFSKYTAAQPSGDRDFGRIATEAVERMKKQLEADYDAHLEKLEKLPNRYVISSKVLLRVWD